nr:hypothetical protein [Tanacetum cinerariifolium]
MSLFVSCVMNIMMSRPQTRVSVQDEFEEDLQKEHEEKFEEDPKEDPEEELKVRAEDDVPPLATPPVGSLITPQPFTYEVEGPSSVSLFSPFYLHGSEIARLDDNTKLLLSNVKYLKRCEKKRKAEMEANSFEIRKTYTLDTTNADSSTPSRFDHHCLLGLHGVARPISVGGLPHYLPFPSSTNFLPPRKRFRDSNSPKDSVKEDIDTDVLEEIEADAMTIEVAVDRDVEAGVDTSIGMEVDVGIDIEDEADSSDKEHLEQYKEGLQDIYDHVIKIPLQRIEDIKTRQRELEERSLSAGRERASLLKRVASLERSNARLRGTTDDGESESQ